MAADRIRGLVQRLYVRLLEREISATPDHVAVIQDGNRQYTRERGKDKTDAHRAGAETTEAVMRWCDELGIRELTLYAFSTENFKRPQDEREALFDLIADRLYSFADKADVHDRRVRIRAIGETHRLPDRVQEAIDYAEARTEEYSRLQLNVALAYGGRNELLDVTRAFAREAAAGTIDPADITVSEVKRRVMEWPTQPVDLIIRTGGEKRTSNFLPWHASGNEAAAYFCTPYWPEFSRVDLLRAIRTYESREESWQRSRLQRAITLAGAIGESKPEVASRLLEKLREEPDTEAKASKPEESSTGD